jgi:hypothetical protein
VDRVTAVETPHGSLAAPAAPVDPARVRTLQTLGIFCGLTAGA